MEQRDNYKATIRIGDKSITFEGPREFVEEQVAQYTFPSTSKQQALASRNKQGAPTAPSSEREIIGAKHPRSHSEVIAVLAFYFAENGLPEFTGEDIRRAYIRAGVRPPKVISQAIRDAKNRYEYVEPAATRGKYRLSAHGDRTVRFDLPRR